jgi:hypothetical protein
MSQHVSPSICPQKKPVYETKWRGMPTCYATLTRGSSTAHVSRSHDEGASAEYTAGHTRPHATVTEPLHTILLCGGVGRGVRRGLAGWAGSVFG